MVRVSNVCLTAIRGKRRKNPMRGHILSEASTADITNALTASQSVPDTDAAGNRDAASRSLLCGALSNVISSIARGDQSLGSMVSISKDLMDGIRRNASTISGADSLILSMESYFNSIGRISRVTAKKLCCITSALCDYGDEYKLGCDLASPLGAIVDSVATGERMMSDLVTSGSDAISSALTSAYTACDIAAVNQALDDAQRITSVASDIENSLAMKLCCALNMLCGCCGPGGSLGVDEFETKITSVITSISDGERSSNDMVAAINGAMVALNNCLVMPDKREPAMMAAIMSNINKILESLVAYEEAMQQKMCCAVKSACVGKLNDVDTCSAAPVNP